MWGINILISLLFIGIMAGCKHKSPLVVGVTQSHHVFVQPFDNIDTASVSYVAEELSRIIPGVRVQAAIRLPQQAYYKSRNRYRADSIIRYLASMTFGNDVTLGLTIQDISTTKGNVKDWGVMGLGYCPGKACVASSFRLTAKTKDSQFFKVAIHELGHTMGLPHCPEKTCYMRDAEGGNPTDEEYGFCDRCKIYLKNKGWVIK